MFIKHNLTRKNIKNEYSISTTNHESTTITSTNIGNKTGSNLEITATAPQFLKLNNIQFPASDGLENQVLSTNGSGVLSFISTISGELINDTTPQLSGDLDINSNNIGGNGNIDITGSIQCSSSLTCSNLNVNGTTTNINTETLTIDDPLIYLAENNTGNTLDIGWYGKFNDGSVKYAGMIRDATDAKFKVFTTTTEPSTTIENISLANLEINDLDCNSIDSGTWAGNNLTKSQITDLTSDLTSINSSISTNTASASSNASSISANTGNVTANSNSISITNGNVTANTASASTNASNISTNTGNISTNTASASSNASSASSNASSISANSTNISANSTNISTNTASASTNTTNINLKAPINNALLTGNVGIGTNNPSEVLHIVGDLRIDGNIVDSSGVHSSVSKWNVNGDHVYNNNSGNVGIGTNNPSYKLDVNGTGRFTGNLTCNNFTGSNSDIIMSCRIGRDAHETGFLCGGSNNIGNNATKTNPIYAAAGTLAPAETSLSSFHGIGFCHKNASFITGTADGWGLYVAAGSPSVARIFLGADSWSTSYINTDGNFGIGTDSPAYKLDVNGDINFTGTLYQNGSAFSSGGAFTESNSEAYYLGNVGIGTNNPSSRLSVCINSTSDTSIGNSSLVARFIDKLHQNAWTGIGFGGYYENTAKSAIIHERTNGYGRGSLHLCTNNTNDTSDVALDDARLTITASGNVGIGDTTPSYKLDVNGTGRFTGHLTMTGTNNIYFNDTNERIRSDGGNLELWAGGAERMSVGGNGSVGIGTTNPAEKLHISVNGTCKAIIEGNEAGESHLVLSTGPNGSDIRKNAIVADGLNSWKRANMHFVLNSNSNNNDYVLGTDTKMIIMGLTGNVGINNTSPAQKLDVNGNATIGTTGEEMFIGNIGHTNYAGIAHEDRANTTDYALLQHSNGTTLINCKSGTAIEFKKNNSEIMRIHNNGNVGIGTNNPAQKLDVNGNIRCDKVISTDSGQILNSVFINNVDIVNSNINSTSYETIVNYNHTPLSGSSKILISFDCEYNINGWGADTFNSNIVCTPSGGGTPVTLQTKTQLFRNHSGGGGRASSLFPISAVYTNNFLIPIMLNFKVQAKRSGADDNVNISTLSDNTFILQEIAN